MKENIIGRKEEIAALKQYIESDRPEFIGLYGRRRIGKTYLVNQLFREEMSFSVSGLINGTKAEQVSAFKVALRMYGYEESLTTSSWIDLFYALQRLLACKLAGNNAPCIIFIDELPCFDTQKGAFIRALGNFWNAWASQEPRVKLIVCGSATSWMVKNLINNRAGLHNRLTHEMHLSAFSLSETQQYLRSQGIEWSPQTIAQTYMILGGVPYYLSLLDKRQSLTQNIDRLYFSKKGELHSEYNKLYTSLFDNVEPYLKVLGALAQCKNGISKKDLTERLSVASNGHLTTILTDLMNCDIIREYHTKSKIIKRNGAFYQLTDFFTLFHLYFSAKRSTDEAYLQHNLMQLNAWWGYAFERLCMVHIPQIKKALGISNIGVEYYSWRSNDPEEKAQIDLVMERADKITHLCEVKYCDSLYTIDKEESLKYKNRIAAFARQTQTKASIFTLFITPFGLTKNGYSSDIRDTFTLDDLFQ
ncbi:MAG: ATP-binding protein [Paludibacteraceae bacterium]|nr:ATP-binding protein [Paludibacteraceae bacterium]